MKTSKIHQIIRLLSVLAVACLIQTGTVSAAPVPAQPVTIFADVPSGHWAKQWIEALYSSGLTGGCGNGNYCPAAIVTRDQIAVFLLRGIRGSSYLPPAASGTMFDDVPSDHWAAAWIEQLAIAGITTGCGNGRFCPGSAVTRDQMAVLLLRSRMGTTFAPPSASGTMFSDVPRAFWAAAWIEELARHNITGGCGGGRYCPGSVVTRDQMAVFLVHTFDLQAPDFETLVVLLINSERDDHGLARLTARPQLAAAASAHSADMADNDYFSHDSQDGSTLAVRVARQGYSWQRLGENIAAGYPTPEAVVEGWMNSDGHRANILDSRFTEIGVGYAYNPASTYGAYWTADFARPPR